VRRLRPHLTYANTMVTLLAIGALTGGVAYAANTVGSADVIDNSLLSADLKNNQAVKSADVTNENLTGVDLADGTLGGADLGDNSLTGADLSESSLGQVPSALTASLGGIGRSAGGGVCDPESDVFVTCRSVALTLPAPSRVLIIGRIKALTETDAAIGRGDCRVGTSVTGGVAGSQASLETGENNGDFQESAAFLGVSSVIGPGAVSFGIDCNQDEQVGAIRYSNAGISAVTLSAG